jgi:intracellular multiplication protein IcmE
MASKKENLKKLFSDTRSRNVVLITGFLLVVMVVVGLIALKDRLGGTTGVTGSTKVSGRGAARVRSIPGALRPSEEYVKLVQKANLEAAERAKKSGNSAIPTIVKTKELSESNIPLMPKDAVKGVSFSTLARGGGSSRGFWFDKVLRSKCSPEALADARQAGAKVADLRAAGCSAKQLLAAGYTLAQLKDGGYTASELRAAGFSAAQLRAAGFSAADLRNAGYSACELKAAGFTAAELRAAGFSDGELRGAGFTAEEIAGSTGLPAGMTEDDLIKLSCENNGILQARKRGVSAKKIREFLGISAKRLSQVGYGWKELQKGGYTAHELLQAGGDCAQLKAAGFSVQALVETNQCLAKLQGIGLAANELDAAVRAVQLPVGVTLDALVAGGCSDTAVAKAKAAGVGLEQIKRSVGCSAKAMRQAGFNSRQLRVAGYTAHDLSNSGVSSQNLLASGYTDAQVKAASLLPGCIDIAELQKAGCAPEALSELRRKGVRVEDIKEYNGCSAGALLQAGFSAAALKEAGYTSAALAKAGQSCAQLRQAGSSAQELLNSGICTENELLAAGFSPEEVAAAKIAKLSGGYTAAQLRAIAGIPDALRKARLAGVTASDLHRLGGFDARTLRNAGYSAKELLDAGFSPRDLLKAGFTEAELRAAGVSANEIRLSKNLPAGLTPRDVRAGCCSHAAIAKLRKAGVDAHAIHEIAGCSTRALRQGGFGAEDLLDAGFTPHELFITGFDCGQLVRNGVSAASLLEAKLCSVNDLLDNGFTATQLSAAQSALKLPGGYTGDKVKLAGCFADKVRQGRKAGITAGYYLRVLSCSAQTMRVAGFTLTQLQRAGYSVRELLHGGFSESDLLRAGYTQHQLDSASDMACVACSSQSPLKAGGCTKLALQDARTSGLAAGDIHDIITCSAEELLLAGYDAAELRQGGFTSKALKQAGLSCTNLKDSGVDASELLHGGACQKLELKTAGFSAQQVDAAILAKLSSGYDYDKFINAGCKVEALQQARNHGVNAGEIHRLLGCSAKALKAAGFSSGELKLSSYSVHQLKAAGFSAKDLRIAGFSAKALRNVCFTASELKAAGFSASDLAKAGFSAKELLAAGFDAKALREAGFSAKELLDAGVPLKTLLEAGYTTKDLMDAGVTAKGLRAAGISPDKLDAEALKKAGLSAAEMKKAGYSCAQLYTMGYAVSDLRQAGCSAAELLAAGVSIRDLKDAGYTAKELLDSGVPLKDLLKHYSVAELKAAGVSAADLIKAGVKPRDLLNAGFTVQDLKDAGLTAKQLRQAGITAAELLKGGFSEDEIRKAGFTTAQLGDAGILPLTGLPGQVGGNDAANQANQQLEAVYRRQTAQIDAQKFQQEVQKRLTRMQGEAVKTLAQWRMPVNQTYAEGKAPEKKKDEKGSSAVSGKPRVELKDRQGNVLHRLKAGDILYAILDTSINSDETAPILATITHGPLKGGKLIGTMTKPANAQSVLVTFNTVSLPQFDHSLPLTAYAIDQNTARTALASRVDNHFLLKYGSIIATSFLDGFGQAFMQQGTSVSATTGSTTVTVGSRTAGEAALIGLGKLGQKLGQATSDYQTKPPTVYVYSGTPIGVFITADVEIK